MGIGSTARNYGRFKTQTLRSMPATAEVHAPGRDWEDITDDVLAKCLQDAPALDTDGQKIIIDFSAFEACLRVFLSADDETATSLQEASAQRVQRNVVTDEDAFHTDCAEAVEEVCI
ncbi:MAG: hypothetical protein NT159_02925 [Proteobacteria bacterium]|nr:hypothetical protein [Pseudomonadota bacterium]